MKVFFRFYIYLRDMEPRKQMYLFTAILGIWLAIDFLIGKQ